GRELIAQALANAERRTPEDRRLETEDRRPKTGDRGGTPLWSLNPELNGLRSARSAYGPRSAERSALAKALHSAARLAYQQDEYPSARRLHEESLAIYQAMGDKGGICRALGALGYVAKIQGDYASARRFLERSLEIGREVGDKMDIANSLIAMGHIAEAEGDYEAARECHQQSLAIAREAGYVGVVTWSLY